MEGVLLNSSLQSKITLSKGYPQSGTEFPSRHKRGLAVLMVAVILEQHGCRAVSHYTQIVIGQVSPNCSPSPKPFHKERQLLNMSRVSIREEDRSRCSVELFFSVPPAMEYITNVSTRKVVYSSGK
uniref:Uncharacterized protein n=1 Tax=Magallana gigas TaxID=29159 RepID=A0A8W8IEG6_MAGGI